MSASRSLFPGRAQADRLLTFALLFGWCSGTTQKRNQPGADRSTQTGTGIPPGTGGKCSVVARDNVAKRRCRLRGIDLRLDKSSAGSVLLVAERDQPRPERGNCTRPTNDQVLPVNANLVAGNRVGIASYIGHTSPTSARRRRWNLCICLPGWQSKYIADTATCRTFTIGLLVPHDFRRDGAASSLQSGCPTGKHMRAGSREVDVVPCSSVRRTVVAGGDRDRDTERGCGLAGSVQRIHGLRRPTGFRSAPANRDHTGLVGRIVYGAGESVDKALIGVGCEVNDNLRPRCYGSGYLDIQHHLAICAIRVARSVLAPIHRYCGELRCGQAQAFEVGGEVGGPIATAQFDNADGLARGSCTLGKLVKLAYLDRGVGSAGCGDVGAGEAASSGCLRIDGLTQDAEVRLGLGAIVEAQDRVHCTGQFRGDKDAALADAIGDTIKNFLREPDAKRLLHGGGGPG